MAEFPDLGQRCALETCSQFDFLPFECELCRQTFCLEHRTPSAHGCAQLSPLSSCEYTGPTGTIQTYECFLSSCRTRELMPVVCPKCSNNYCLTHRHPDDHECASVNKVAKDSKKPSDPPKAIQAPACRGRKSQRTSLQVTLMKLKMKAKGSASISAGDRVYFEVQVTADKGSTMSLTCGYFFSKDWTVGKSVDYVATQEKLTNLNNIMGGKKLRLFKVDEEGCLLTDLSWAELLDCGTIDNGSTLILKYIEELSSEM